MSIVTNDPSNYRMMSEPFDDATQANQSLEAFFADVKAARDRHLITDVSVVVQVAIRAPDGERKACASAYFGDPLANKLVLLAREYGAAREQHEQILGDVIEAGRRYPCEIADERLDCARDQQRCRSARRVRDRDVRPSRRAVVAGRPHSLAWQARFRSGRDPNAGEGCMRGRARTRFSMKSQSVNSTSLLIAL